MLPDLPFTIGDFVMFFVKQELEAAGLHWEVTDEVIVITGSQPFPTQVDRALKKITEELHLTAREHDELQDHVANLTVWSILRKIAG